MSEFEDFEVKPNNDIYGCSTINHAIRHRLGLSIAEYCVADWVNYCNETRKIPTYEYAFRKLAIKKDQLSSLLAILQEKGFIATEEKNINTTRKWMDAFMISEEWFNAFWFVGSKAFWPGSKEDARKKFVKVCRKYSPEFIIQCRDYYIRFMGHPSNQFRQVMGAPVFLNPETERFKEDWIGNLKRLNGTEFKVPRKVEKISMKEKKEMFQ